MFLRRQVGPMTGKSFKLDVGVLLKISEEKRTHALNAIVLRQEVDFCCFRGQTFDAWKNIRGMLDWESLKAGTSSRFRDQSPGPEFAKIKMVLIKMVCLVMVEWLFLAVPWGCLQLETVAFPDHTHLLF